MSIYLHHGVTIVESDDDIFRVQAQAIVNPVNTVGVMGKGLAKEVRDRYPDIYEHYRTQCKSGHLQIGHVLVSYIPRADYFRNGVTEMIIHFPTKRHWKESADYSYIEEGLHALAQCTLNSRLYSIAIPPLGCGLGGLDPSKVKGMILDIYIPRVEKYLKQVSLLRFN